MAEPPDGTVSEQYFAERPRSASDRRELRFLYRGLMLTVRVDRGVFASTALDPGTALLIESLDPGRADRILDLGCGWGPIGLAAARAAPEGHVVLTDVNRRAALLARGNLRRNNVTNAEVRIGASFAPVAHERFDLIATNPPYHAGRELILEWLAEVPDHLAPGGRLLLVGKGSQGILFYQRWLEERAHVEVVNRGGGYRVLEVRYVDASAPGPSSDAGRSGPADAGRSPRERPSRSS
jgi:16S rRNA (guanine1207-N2)-methyltransferase